MTSEKERQDEVKQEARLLRCASFLNTDLGMLLLRQGKQLGGIRIKDEGSSILLVITVSRSAEGCQILFVGGRDLVHATNKAADQIRNETAKWREDKWAMQKLRGSD